MYFKYFLIVFVSEFCDYGQLDSEKLVSSGDSQTTHDLSRLEIHLSKWTNKCISHIFEIYLSLNFATMVNWTVKSRSARGTVKLHMGE